MRIEEASNLINKVPKGFRVSYSKKKGIMLGYGQFPEEGWLPHEELAWTWAKMLAKSSPGVLVNFRVIDHNGNAVSEERNIENR